MPISKQAAQAQMDRMGQLSYPPKTRTEINELVAALELADSDSVAEFVVTEWLERSREWPKPFDLRFRVREINANSRHTRTDCEMCSGSGIVVAWFLVTYDGQSFNIRKCSRLDFRAEWQAQEFREKLARPLPRTDWQDVISAAGPCACRAIRSTAA